MKMTADEYENSLFHYGILRKSGRYPWGTGANPHQRSKSFLDIIKDHRREGLSDSEIAKLYDDPEGKYPFKSSDLRAVETRAVTIQKEAQIRQAQRLKEKGMGASEIGRHMGVNESTVRSLLEPGRLDRLNILQQTADMLKRQVAEKGMIDIGAHVERDLPIGDNPETRIGLPKDKFNTAVSMLKEEGYAVGTYRSPQVGTGDMTTYRVLFKPSRPGMDQKAINREAHANRENLQLISEKTKDGGRTYTNEIFAKPLSISSKRVGVRYKEEGGADADGVIYVRPGVHDIRLGKSQYAQVRIAIDGTHFLKGMAVYKNDLPPGVDLLFNTNKSNTGNKLDALKPLKTDKNTGEIDWKNPFGSFPKLVGGQLKDEHNNVDSAMNILNEQGDWNKWSRTLSRQVLSKQSPDVAKSQLALTYDRKRQEFEEIKALTNPLIKKKLLETFSDEVDSSSVHLKAAAMPKQVTRVLLPVKSMKPDEIFAPSFKDGDRVALVRFPHAGRFEIPELTVNNKNREANQLFKKDGKLSAPDAVGIHPKVAERLSGADFDGDTVLVIPNRKGLISTKPPLEGLKDFDPQTYKVPKGPKTKEFPDGTPIITDRKKQDEMGRITNLIADMTLRGANDAELARAVRHSMVVIDSEKHNLDYKASEREHGILELKKRYQGVHDNGQLKGASTLITRATSQERVRKRKDAFAGPGVTRLSNATVDNKTGKKVYKYSDEVDAKGKPRTFRSRKLAETDDAFSLVSEHGGLPIERVYAEHSNKLKDLANEVRLETVRTPKFQRSKSAAKVYEKEVQSLNAQLNDALKNAPLERKAQALANQVVGQRKRANPDMEHKELKKIKGQALEEARVRTGAKKHRIDISDDEWRAIQAGAISADKLSKILANTDVDKLKDRATPKARPVMTDVMSSRAKTMLSSGATYAEISEALGIPESTLQSSLADGG